MMKKLIAKVAVLTAALTLMASVPALASSSTGNYKYYMDAQNYRVGAEHGEWVRNPKGWWFEFPNGSWPANTWLKDMGVWYYFNADGYMATGWIQYKGDWYYLDSNGAMWWSITTPDGHYVDGSGKRIR